MSILSLEVEYLIPTMDKLVAYRSHIKFTNFVFAAGLIVMLPKTGQGLLYKLRCNWMCIYSILAMVAYSCVVIFEPVNLEELCGIIWTSCAIIQQSAKGVNALFLNKTIKQLFDWTDRINNPKYETKYSEMIRARIAKSDNWLAQCLRFNSILVFFAATTYMIQPILSRQFVTPTPIKLKGQSEFPLEEFVAIYTIQVIQAYCSMILVIGYDAIFILLISAITHKFDAINDVLKTLQYEGPRNHERDRRILLDCHLMHVDVLE